MFHANKYTRWYMKIVGRAAKRTVKGYSEKHHIIPKSLGGSNAKDNLVNLTAREHYICHWLLIKMTSGSARKKMSYALWTMTRSTDRVKRKLNAAQYETARKHFSETHKGNIKSPEARAKLSKALKGLKRTPEQRKRIAIGRADRVQWTKKWNVTYPDGRTETIDNLAVFCREHKLHQGNLSYHGKTKGFKASEVLDDLH